MILRISLFALFILPLLLIFSADGGRLNAAGDQTSDLPPLAFDQEGYWYRGIDLGIEDIDGKTVSGDFNGDGLDDIAAVSGPGPGNIQVWLSNGGSFDSPSAWYNLGSDDPPINFYEGLTVSGDFNNDGNDDIAALLINIASGGGGPALAVVYLSDGEDGFRREEWGALEQIFLINKGRVVSGDFDGDGWRDDVAILHAIGPDAAIFVLKADGSKFSSADSWGRFDGFDADRVADRVVAGDFGADGKDDIGAIYEHAYSGDYRTSAYVFRSTGGSFVKAPVWWDAGGYNAAEATGRVTAGDVDGDGDDDMTLIYRYPSLTRAHVLLSNRFNKFMYQGNSGWWARSDAQGFEAGQFTGRVVSGDFDGDGVDYIGMVQGDGDMIIWVLNSTAVSVSDEQTHTVDADFCDEPGELPVGRHCDVQSAIDAAPYGGTISITTGIYEERLKIPRYPNPGFNQEVTLSGVGVDNVFVDGQNQGTVVDIGAYGYARLDNLTIRRGFAPVGGGILVDGQLAASSMRITNNASNDYGGGLHVTREGVALLDDVLLDKNNAVNGGAVSIIEGLADISNSRLESNSAAGEGGAIHNIAGDLVVWESTISGNRASYGGGIALKIASQTSISRSTFSINTAVGSGGAIVIAESSVAALRQNTISENKAANGAVNISSNSNTFMAANTIAGNESTGVAYVGPDAILQFGFNLLADNEPSNCEIEGTTAGVESLDNNMATDNSCVIFGTGDYIVPQAYVSTLVDNGGPTQTMALLPASPAIDVYEPSERGCDIFETDQRGVRLPQDGDGDGEALCDVGAFEFQEHRGLLYLPLTVGN